MDTTENDGAGIDDDVLPPFTLRKPVKIGDKEYRTLEFREATSQDLKKAGFLARFSEDGTNTVDPAVALRLAWMISSPPVLPALMDKMSYRDGMALTKHVAHFFGKED